jgi:DNA (cytosine-5)-methyltransferase 1
MPRVPKLLDLFACAGGASMGYHMAGFDVTGVDLNPQPNYPFEFHQADALQFVEDHGHEYDAITASPPCQAYSTTRALHSRVHPQLIEPVRSLLESSGKPYVIENVPGAPLKDPVVLCGSMFGLRVRRHRLFESNTALKPLTCDHDWQDDDKAFELRVSKARGKSRWSGIVPVHGSGQLLFDGEGNPAKELQVARYAMGIDWMTKKELNQAIPPAYTKYLGEQLIQHV